MNLRTPLFLIMLAAMPLSGCKALDFMLIYVDNEYAGGNYQKELAEAERLQARRDSLQKGYDDTVSEIQASINTSKSTIETHIKNKEIGAALTELATLDNLLHGTEGTTKNYFRKVVSHSGNEQKDYIRDAAKRTLTAVDAVMDSGRFQKLDTWLATHHTLTQMDATTRKGFTKKQAQLNAAWLIALTAASDRTMVSHPGSSLVYAIKAQELARELDDQQALATLSERVEALILNLDRDHGYVYTMGSLSGTHTQDVVAKVGNLRWGMRSMRHQSTHNARTDAILDLTLGSPEYRRSKSKTTRTFSYKSGTKQVPNPAYESAQSDISRYQDDVQSHQDDLKNMRRDTQGWENNEKSYRNQLAAAQKNLQSARSKLSGVSETVTQDVYSDYSYPITVHHMEGTWSMNTLITSSHALPAQLKDKTVTIALKDEEHSAHSKSDGSVSADPARPPTEQSTLSGLKLNTIKEIEGLLGTAFLAHQANMLHNLSSSGENLINQLAIYTFLDPRAAQVKTVQQLEDLADVNGLVELLKNNK